MRLPRRAVVAGFLGLLSRPAQAVLEGHTERDWDRFTERDQMIRYAVSVEIDPGDARVVCPPGARVVCTVDGEVNFTTYVSFVMTPDGVSYVQKSLAFYFAIRKATTRPRFAATITPPVSVTLRQHVSAMPY